MKRLVVAMVIASVVAFGAGAAYAIDGVSYEYHDDMTHPLRMAAYVVHPVGFVAEWLVARPFHYLITRPYLDEFFGYEAISYEGEYQR